MLNTFSSSSFGFFFSVVSAVFFFLPFPLLLPFTREWLVLISKYRLVKVDEKSTELETWIPHEIAQSSTYCVQEALHWKVHHYVSVQIVCGGTGLRVLCICSHVTDNCLCARLFWRLMCDVCFLSFIWTTFMVRMWTLCRVHGRGQPVFPHMETWIHVSMYRDIHRI